MPVCGSQIAFCDMPLRFDTYVGCSHGCEYCFVRRKMKNLNDIGPGESSEALQEFIDGARTLRTCWVDWPLPIHWGGMSDGFQPIEDRERRSLSALRVFARTQYPVLISTKGVLIGTDPWLETLAKCNAAVQVSAVAPSYEKIEPGVASFSGRMTLVKRLVPAVKRVLVRIQPLMLSAVREVAEVSLPAIAETGAHGVIVECLKYHDSSTYPGLTEKLGGDLVYPYNRVHDALCELREVAKGLGLAFYVGENRFRAMGDSLNCCGTDGIPDWVPNRCNLNHLFWGGYAASPAQQEPGSSDVFGSLYQDAGSHQMIRSVSFEQCLQEVARSEDQRYVMGLLTPVVEEGLF